MTMREFTQLNLLLRIIETCPLLFGRFFLGDIVWQVRGMEGRERVLGEESETGKDIRQDEVKVSYI